MELEKLFQRKVFLDSDDLSDLRNLLQHVRDTKCLVLLQSRGVLTRPWVLMELYTALTSGVPIVALNVQNANPVSSIMHIGLLLPPLRSPESHSRACLCGCTP